MELRFVKMNPSGNITILVTDPVPRADHLSLARILMSPEYLAAEQVGYVEEPEDPRAAARLQMMGGEFCGNAARALAALLVERSRETEEQSHGALRREPSGSERLSLEVSGSERLLPTVVRVTGEGAWWTELTVPSPRSLREEIVTVDGREVSLCRVTMPGIEHLILADVSPSVTVYDQFLRQDIFAAEAEARGIMFYDARRETMTPLVAVGEETPVWEGSCGSGSVALAAALAARKGSSLQDLRIRQPGGELTVDAEWDGEAVTVARIKGHVERIAAGTVRVPAAATSRVTSRSR